MYLKKELGDQVGLRSHSPPADVKNKYKQTKLFNTRKEKTKQKKEAKDGSTVMEPPSASHRSFLIDLEKCSRFFKGGNSFKRLLDVCL